MTTENDTIETVENAASSADSPSDTQTQPGGVAERRSRFLDFLIDKAFDRCTTQSWKPEQLPSTRDFRPKTSAKRKSSRATRPEVSRMGSTVVELDGHSTI